MEVKREINDYWNLKEMCWSGALDTLNEIEGFGLEEELMELLEEVFGGEVVDEVEINDYLWFESENIYQELGLEYCETKGEWLTEDEKEEYLDNLEEMFENEPSDLTEEEKEFLREERGLPEIEEDDDEDEKEEDEEEEDC